MHVHSRKVRGNLPSGPERLCGRDRQCLHQAGYPPNGGLDHDSLKVQSHVHFELAVAEEIREADEV